MEAIWDYSPPVPEPLTGRYGANLPDDYDPNLPGSPEYDPGPIPCRECVNYIPCDCGCGWGWCEFWEIFVEGKSADSDEEFECAE